jgi:hypothetical protein
MNSGSTRPKGEEGYEREREREGDFYRLLLMWGIK